MQVPKKAWVFVAVVAITAISLAVFEWNWLRSPFSNYLNGRIGRPVSIDGDLRDANSPIRCVVSDFLAENGNMTALTLVMDTEAEKILGEGSVNFATERYDLRLNAKSKRTSLLALRGPIIGEGTFKSPQVHPAVGPIATRVGTSVALGVAATPLAALLPLIDFGGAIDADCQGLMQDAKDNVQAQRVGPKLSRECRRARCRRRSSRAVARAYEAHFCCFLRLPGPRISATASSRLRDRLQSLRSGTEDCIYPLSAPGMFDRGGSPSQVKPSRPATRAEPLLVFA